MRFIFVIFILCLSWESAGAESLDVPVYELSDEAAIPDLDTSQVVLNRRIVHKKKFEFSIYSGVVLSEAIYLPYNFGLKLGYYFDNTHAIQFYGSYFMQGLGGTGEKLETGQITNIGGTGVQNIFVSRAPSKEYELGVNYQLTAYYGKLSISKNSVVNLSLFGLMGANAFMIGGEIAPGLNIGFGQSLYLTKKLSLRLDLIGQIYSGFDITSTADKPGRAGKDLSKVTNTKPVTSDFDRSLLIDTNVHFSLSLLL